VQHYIAVPLIYSLCRTAKQATANSAARLHGRISGGHGRSRGTHSRRSPSVVGAAFVGTPARVNPLVACGSPQAPARPADDENLAGLLTPVDPLVLDAGGLGELGLGSGCRRNGSFQIPTEFAAAVASWTGLVGALAGRLVTGPSNGPTRQWKGGRAQPPPPPSSP
jgi:hypothetical protein